MFVLLAIAVFSSGCLSGSSVPGPATAIIPAPVLGDLPMYPEAALVDSSLAASSPTETDAAGARPYADATA